MSSSIRSSDRGGGLEMWRKEVYEARKAFFNERAEAWLDMWYKDHESGLYTRYREEFERLFACIDEVVLLARSD